MCEKWRIVEKFGEKTNKYTLWMRYKVNFNKLNTALNILTSFIKHVFDD